ncbi:MAG: hypothetical protein JWR68_2178, partial [Polaromonas sp.]|nr:hypothetical protein [Polaromonas sp.]
AAGTTAPPAITLVTTAAPPAPGATPLPLIPVTAPGEAPGLLVPDCGAFPCGALNSRTYSGTGIGIWRYNNTSGTTATLDIGIAGVTPGKSATLVFSNGSAAAAASPNAGARASAESVSGVPAERSLPEALSVQERHEHAHTQMQGKNRLISTALIRNRASAGPSSEAGTGARVASPRFSLSPAVGATRSWIDSYPEIPVSYPTSAQFVCALPSGRNIVWWVDPTIVSSGKFTASAWSAALSGMQRSYCGATGGLARLNALLGEVWGPAAAKEPALIQDAPGALQDVNVVLLNVPSSSGWAGYFYGGNNFLKSSISTSNEALAFFINADQIKIDLEFATSTLMHESTHMVNFYERAVARDVVHDTWLEETTAMMTEDIVTPTVVNGYNKVLSYRLPIYLAAGGNVSYINWPAATDPSAHYALGAGFAAFLNRRYGLSIYRQLVDACRDGASNSSALTSQRCLDGLIKANGGAGFADEFARFGGTVFGQLPSVGAPSGYGYPSVVAGPYVLQAKDLSTTRLGPAAPITAPFAATSHAYQRDTLGSGTTTYARSGVEVPANTSLTLVIK